MRLWMCNTIKTRNHCNSNLIEKFLLCTPNIYAGFYYTNCLIFFSLLYWLLYILSRVLVTIWDNTLHLYLKWWYARTSQILVLVVAFVISLGFQIVFVFVFTVSKNKSKMIFFFIHFLLLCCSFFFVIKTEIKQLFINLLSKKKTKQIM